MTIITVIAGILAIYGFYLAFIAKDEETHNKTNHKD